MPDIFISYKKEEHEVANLLATRLTEAGYEVWWDDALLAGERFEDEITDVLDKSELVVILWSKQSVTSDWVKAEAETARQQKKALPVIIDRLDQLNPGPVNGHLPLMIGGTGEKVTLRLAAQYADIWNGFGLPQEAGRLSRVLDDWCAKVGRDPATIERSILFDEVDRIALADDYLRHGITHLIFEPSTPELDFGPVEQLLAWRDSIRFNT